MYDDIVCPRFVGWLRQAEVIDGGVTRDELVIWKRIALVMVRQRQKDSLTHPDPTPNTHTHTTTTTTTNHTTHTTA